MAEIITTDGRIFYGENDCARPQVVCPRTEAGFAHGEGYELCKEICGQEGHAETNALKAAGDGARGAMLFLYGHTRLCDGCRTALSTAGLTEIEIVGGYDGQRGCG